MKRCPFCSEEIQDAAIKCRFCASSLQGASASPASSAKDSAAMVAREIVPKPDSMPAAQPIFGGQPSWKAWFWQYVLAVLFSPLVVGLVWLLVLEARRRGTHYRINTRSIEVEYGVFSKRIETMQLWRVKDLQFTQSLLDRMLGVAHIHVFTRDVTDPDLMLRGLPSSRAVFEDLKNAADLARQSRNVVGMMD